MSDQKKAQKWMFIMTIIAPVMFFLFLWIVTSYEFVGHNYIHHYDSVSTASK